LANRPFRRISDRVAGFGIGVLLLFAGRDRLILKRARYVSHPTRRQGADVDCGVELAATVDDADGDCDPLGTLDGLGTCSSSPQAAIAALRAANGIRTRASLPTKFPRRKPASRPSAHGAPSLLSLSLLLS